MFTRTVIRTAMLKLLALICCVSTLAACSPPVRPPAKAVPSETLKVAPELLKDNQSK
jgi:hypothetical protein